MVSHSRNRPPAASLSLLGLCQLLSVTGPALSIYCNYRYELQVAEVFGKLAKPQLLRNSTAWNGIFTPALSSSPVA